MILSKWEGQIHLYSSYKNQFTFVFKEFQILEIPNNTLIDCELIAVYENEKYNFELLQNQYRVKVAGLR